MCFRYTQPHSATHPLSLIYGEPMIASHFVALPRTPLCLIRLHQTIQTTRIRMGDVVLMGPSQLTSIPVLSRARAIDFVCLKAKKNTQSIVDTIVHTDRCRAFLALQVRHLGRVIDDKGWPNGASTFTPLGTARLLDLRRHGAHGSLCWTKKCDIL